MIDDITELHAKIMSHFYLWSCVVEYGVLRATLADTGKLWSSVASMSAVLEVPHPSYIVTIRGITHFKNFKSLEEAYQFVKEHLKLHEVVSLRQELNNLEGV